MVQALNILFNATPREVVGHLPIVLGRIREIAHNCTVEANNVVHKYNKVIDTLNEIQIASVAKKVHSIQ
jgi:hypothetical protein